MTNEEYLEALRAAHMARAVFDTIDFKAAVERAEHAESMAPLINPTLYIQNQKKFQEDLAVLRWAASRPMP